MEVQWEETGWFSCAADIQNWSGVETRRSLGSGYVDGFQPSYLYSPALASCHGSNLDVEKPIVFKEDAASFGQTVVQFGGSR